MKNIFLRRKKLTNRQIECLEVLIGIYNEKNEAVHYTEIAPILKISKWSTYDLLKILEKKRLVKPVYKKLDETELNKKGRRAVFFVPSLKSFPPILKQNSLEKRGFIRNLRNLPKISPKLYCISFLTAIGMICLESFQDIIPLMQNYIATLSSNPKSALLFIAYSLVGTVIGNIKSDEAKKIVEVNLEQYKSYIEKMSKKSSKELLNSIVKLIDTEK